MNRKQRIIVSITGIVLVSLILIGLTYAYFLTKITGNTNGKSISVTTANLQIKYEDNKEEILGENLILEPSDNEIGSKTFTVTNEGNSETSYVVVIENVSITNSSDGTTTTFESNDFRYTLTCTKKDGTSCEQTTTKSVFPINGGILVGNSIEVDDVQTYTLKMWYIDTGKNQTNDMGKTLQAKINIKDITQVKNPYSSNTNSLAYNIIENAKNKTNGTELLTVPKSKPAEKPSSIYYTNKVKEATSESSINISTTYQGYYWTYGTGYTIDESTGRFTLTGVSTCKYNDGTCNTTLVGKYLASSYASSNSSSTDTKTKTSNISSSIYKVTEAPTSNTSAITMRAKEISSIYYDTEKVLSVTSDDYGTSYYYRGGVTDNYVNFAGMCWKIVRLQGDGSIKLILEDKNTVCDNSSYKGIWNLGNANFGYTKYETNTLTASDGTKNSSTVYSMNYLNGETNNENSMATAFKNFQEKTLATKISNMYSKSLNDFLKSGDWCLNDKAYATSSDNTKELTSQEILDNQVNGVTFYYDAYVRLYGKTTKEPTLKCNGTIMDKFGDNITNMYVGTLTADEIVYAGETYGEIDGEIDYKNYLINEEFLKGSNGENYDFILSLSPSHFMYSRPLDESYNSVINLNVNSGFMNMEIKIGNAVRPSIILKTNIQITGGNGTKENPYVVE